MLAVRDLHTYYGDSYVLQGVSLDVEPGRVSVLMGRNGVGKTTLIRSVMSLTPPRRGSVMLNGDELVGLPTYEVARRGIALVPQGRRVFNSLTVAEHLESAHRKRGESSWPLERILELFPPLHGRLGQRAGSLSGGEQSMLAIARALRTSPQCVLMDEPTEGLAPRFVEVVLDVISELKSQPDLSLLVVLPDLPLALAVADHVSVMRKGQIAFEGSPGELEDRKDIQKQLIGVG